MRKKWYAVFNNHHQKHKKRHWLAFILMNTNTDNQNKILQKMCIAVKISIKNVHEKPIKRI